MKKKSPVVGATAQPKASEGKRTSKTASDQAAPAVRASVNRSKGGQELNDPQPKRRQASEKVKKENDEKSKELSAKNTATVRTLEKSLRYKFSNPDLLIAAITHSSALARSRASNIARASDHYERLEFLGDAVVDLSVAILLVEQHSKAREGELSKMRAALVRASTLAEIANDLELSKYIHISAGERAAKLHQRPSLLSDVLEAILGAIYLDSNFETVHAISARLFASRLKEIEFSEPKTDLQEFLQALKKSPPVYKLTATDGPLHSPRFVSEVVIEGEVRGTGTGATKKLSQQEAARNALSALRQSDQLQKQNTSSKGQRKSQ